MQIFSCNTEKSPNMWWSVVCPQMPCITGLVTYMYNGLFYRWFSLTLYLQNPVVVLYLITWRFSLLHSPFFIKNCVLYVILWFAIQALWCSLALSNCIYFIKTHGSESRGQERAKRSSKTKRTTNYCVFYTSKSFCHLTS